MVTANKLILNGFHYSRGELKKNAPESGRLTFLSLMTKPICNIEKRCLYCSAGPRLGKELSKAIPLPKYEKIIKDAKRLGARTVVFPGLGEPTCDENLKPLVKFSYGLELIPVIYTNCLFSRGDAQFFAENNASLIMKIDTLNPKHYEELNRAPFAKFEESLRAIIDAFAGTVSGVITRLAGCSVATKINKNDLEKVSEFCAKYDIEYFVSALSKVGYAKRNWKKLVGNEWGELCEIVAGYGTGITSSTLDQRCGVYRYGITFNYNGDAVGCPTMPNIVLGNIRENPFAELLREHAKRLQKEKHYCLAREMGGTSTGSE